MKKIIKSMLALLTSLAMVVGLALPAFADDTYTITAPDNNHVYQIYQIMTGEVSGSTISDAKWGTNAKGKTVGSTVESTTLNTIAALTGTDNAKAKALAEYVDLESTPVATVTKGGSASVVSGYYLIKDYNSETNLKEKDDAYTLYLIKVLGENVTIEPKTGTPTVEKKVYDEDKGFNDGATYDIGDTIPYKLTATLGDTSAYSTYYVQFDDALCDGLALDESSVHVYVVPSSAAIDSSSTKEEIAAAGTEVTGQFTKTLKDATTKDGVTEGGTLYVTCNDIKSLKDGDNNTIDVSTGTKIIVVYDAVLTTEANIGSTGNLNEVKLEYSNNPNEETDGKKKPSDTGTTTKDDVKVWTFQLTVTKVKSDDTALSGAKFTLYKGSVDDANKVGEEMTGTGADGNIFTWKGLDNGTYVISETTTPPGYKTADPITFTITADWDKTQTDPQLKSLTVDNSLFTVEIDSGTSTYTGNITTSVTNLTTSELPSTGGIGNYWFYGIGAVLMAGAAFYFLRSKKASE